MVGRSDQEDGPEPVVGGLVRENVLLGRLVRAHQVAEAAAFVPGIVGVDRDPNAVPVPGGDEP
eukprot:9165413-Alexandrium_andersonii.AAC.1